MMKMIVDTKVDIIKYPKNKISVKIYELTKPQTKFDFAMMICIILNMLVLAMSYESESIAYKTALS